MPPTTSAYDAGAAGYDRFTGQWSRLYAPCLVAAAEVATGHSVLDVAAGTGEAAVALASRVGTAGQVIAVDLSLPMLRDLILQAEALIGRGVKRSAREDD